MSDTKCYFVDSVSVFYRPDLPGVCLILGTSFVSSSSDLLLLCSAGIIIMIFFSYRELLAFCSDCVDRVLCLLLMCFDVLCKCI